MTKLPVARIIQLVAGSATVGVGIAVLVRCQLGLLPWDVWHTALSVRFSLSMGLGIIITNILLMLAWIPLKVRPGIGTVVGIVVPGFACDAALSVLPSFDSWALRVPLVFVGAILFSFGSAAYLGASWGPGPRDGLMMGFAARGYSIRVTRTLLEVGVLLIGWLIAGPLDALKQGYVGIGTVVFALSAGPIIGYLLPRLRYDSVHRQPHHARRAHAVFSLSALLHHDHGTHHRVA